ncbi:MAG: hypothetical protein DBX44_00395 [Oscillospiraceae bacterium]|nr:MAG: hypothetical protein DBX44_00395 [Oscillospiraceae bacterium]
MDYPILKTPGEPRFDSLGVLKLRCTCAVPVNDRIFAQGQVGATDSHLYVRIWSFETSPAPQATLRAVFSHNGHTADLSVTAGGESALLLDGQPAGELLTAYQISGEDLQGEYWGAVMAVPFDRFSQALGLAEQDSFDGNLLREHPALSSAAPVGQTVRFLLR